MKNWRKWQFVILLAVIIIGPLAMLPVKGEMNLPARPTTDIYVQDYLYLLDAETKAELLAVGYELDQKTTAQLVVVTVNSLHDLTIEDYALELFRTWGIGHQTKNNGVLLLIAPNERQSRIEVGYGLEGALPDGKTGRIQDEYLLPKFQEGDFSGGIADCYLTLARVIAEEYQIQLSGNTYSPSASVEHTSKNLSSWQIALIVLGIIFLFYLDFRFLGGAITLFLLNSIFRGGGSSGGSGRGGGGGFGGGSSGGGGSSRHW